MAAGQKWYNCWTVNVRFWDVAHAALAAADMVHTNTVWDCSRAEQLNWETSIAATSGLPAEGKVGRAAIRLTGDKAIRSFEPHRPCRAQDHGALWQVGKDRKHRNTKQGCGSERDWNQGSAQARNTGSSESEETSWEIRLGSTETEGGAFQGALPHAPQTRDPIYTSTCQATYPILRFAILPGLELPRPYRFGFLTPAFSQTLVPLLHSLEPRF